MSGKAFVLKVGKVHALGVQQDEEGRARNRRQGVDRPRAAWTGCFRHHDGTIYFTQGKRSVDGGKTIAAHGKTELAELSIFHTSHYAPSPGPEGIVLSRPDLFLALGGRPVFGPPGEYYVRAWRSTDDLDTVEDEKAALRIPEGPKPSEQGRSWSGMYLSRSILELRDGSLVITAYGYFETDRIVPTSLSGQRETRYMNRAFLLRSQDEGRSWDYYSSIAVPQEGQPIVEGFCEPTMIRLDSGDLFCVLRTGHHSPLYSCWSSDEGRTWSAPTYTGLERGCYPCLVKLADGRVLLSYGKRFPEGWSKLTPSGDHERWRYPGAGLVKLAISADGTGTSWQQATIGSEMGSCYSTIFEVEPNLILCQVDDWYWRTMLMPRISDML
jgi:hypothetical protein